MIGNIFCLLDSLQSTAAAAATSHPPNVIVISKVVVVSLFSSQVQSCLSAPSVRHSLLFIVSVLMVECDYKLRVTTNSTSYSDLYSLQSSLLYIMAASERLYIIDLKSVRKNLHKICLSLAAAPSVCQSSHRSACYTWLTPLMCIL